MDVTNLQQVQVDSKALVHSLAVLAANDKLPQTAQLLTHMYQKGMHLQTPDIVAILSDINGLPQDIDSLLQVFGTPCGIHFRLSV